MRFAVVRLWACLLLAGISAACSPLTEQERFDRADRLNQAKENYLAREQQCMRMGGAMQMRSRPLGKPDYLDYQTASCVSR
ncbi:MAG: hypothetical protein R3358_14320 [Woeseiaceae bacterium]|nr:hypothetical protein [Woeseiaceae bacterium]